MTERCFLCGRPMKEVEGLLYKLCTNPKCCRSKPLNPPKVSTEEDETTKEGKAVNA